jgi:hypothetical protein
VGEAAAAPADVIVHTVRRTGSVGEEIVAEIESRGYDLVISRLWGAKNSVLPANR